MMDAVPKAVAVRPADAATLIVLDRSRKAPRVLMGRRHPDQRFMPNVFVFPGGRVEPEDRKVGAAGCLDHLDEVRLMAQVTRGSSARARALALAAIRETFEETGLMLGLTDYGPPPNAAGPWAPFSEAGVMPDLEALAFVGRAITPPGRGKRFDTRFFAADRRGVAHEEPGRIHADGEFTELDWFTLAQASKLDIPRPTRVMLAELQARLDAGFHRHLPVPFYRASGQDLIRSEL